MTDRIVIEVSAATGDAVTGLRAVGTAATGLETSLSKTGAAVVTFNQGLALMSQVSKQIASSINIPLKTFGAFETQLSRIQAATGASAAELTSLKKVAEDLGRTSQFNATQVAEGLLTLGRAGRTVTEQIALIKPVLDLATAGQLTMDAAAGALVDTMSQFSLPMGEAGKLTDLFVKAANAANQSTQELIDGMRTAGGSFKAVGFSIEDTTLAVSALAEVGTKGSEAGIALSGFASRIAALQQPTDEAAKALARTGLSFDMLNPKTHDFTQIIDTLHDHHLEYSDFLKLFGEEVARKLVNVVNKGGEALEELTKKIDASSDAALTASKNLGEVDKAYAKLGKAFTGFTTTIGEAMSAPFTELITVITRLLDFADKTILYLGKMRAAIGAVSPSLAKLGNIPAAGGGPVNQNPFTALLFDPNAQIPSQPSKGAAIGAARGTPKGSATAAGRGQGMLAAPAMEQSLGQTLKIIEAQMKLSFIREKLLAADEADLEVYQKVADILETDTIPLGREQLSWAEAEAKVRGKILEDMVLLEDAKEYSLGVARRRAKAEQEASDAMDEAIAKEVFKVGLAAKAGTKIVGFSGAIEGAKAAGPIGAAAGAITDILLSTKALNDAFTKLNEIIVKLFEPIARALAEPLEILAELLDGLTPLFEVFGEVMRIALLPLKLMAQGFKGLVDLLFGVQKHPKAKEDQPAQEGRFFVRKNGIYTGETLEMPKAAVSATAEEDPVEYGGVLGGFLKMIKDITEAFDRLLAWINDQLDAGVKEVEKQKKKIEDDANKGNWLEVAMNPLLLALAPMVSATAAAVAAMQGVEAWWKDRIATIDLLAWWKEKVASIDLLAWLNEKVFPAVFDIVDWIREKLDALVKEGLKFDIIKWARDLLTLSVKAAGVASFGLILWAKEKLEDAIKAAGNTKFDLIDWAKTKLAEAMRAAGEKTFGLIQWIKDILTLSMRAAGEGLFNIVEWTREKLDALVKDMGSFDLIKWLKEKLEDATGGDGGGGDGQYINIPYTDLKVNIPTLGVVDPGGSRSGSTALARTLEPEAAAPMGGINIYVQSVDPKAQKEEIRQLLEELFLTRRLGVA